MLTGAKKVVKTLAPNLAEDVAKKLLVSWRKTSTSRVLRSVRPTDYRLGLAALKSMNMQYPAMSNYGYDPATTKARGALRAEEILNMVPLKQGEVLEVGCWDGMTGAALQSDRVKCTGVDFGEEGFDARATEAGVRLIKMDASNLEFLNEVFDLVFSYNAFEHFKEPGQVFNEIIRVTKPNGYILLDFGPLFMSPWGLHAYDYVRVPYCQFLFTQETLMTFVENEELMPYCNGWRPLGELMPYCNGWRLSQFRNLFADQRVDRLSYHEHTDLSHIGLIKKHAPIFRIYSDSVEELVTYRIGCLFRRKIRGH